MNGDFGPPQSCRSLVSSVDHSPLIYLRDGRQFARPLLASCGETSPGGHVAHIYIVGQGLSHNDGCAHPEPQAKRLDRATAGYVAVGSSLGRLATEVSS